jgi:hypothetical protein
VLAGVLVEVGGVAVAASGHRNVEQRTGGGFVEDGVGGVGGGSLGGVHSYGVAMIDVFSQIIPAKNNAGAVIEPLRGQPVRLGVDCGDTPPVAVAHRVLLGRWVIRVVQRGRGVVSRVRMRSPMAMRCPRAPATVGAPASILSWWMRQERASDYLLGPREAGTSTPVPNEAQSSATLPCRSSPSQSTRIGCYTAASTT